MTCVVCTHAFDALCVHTTTCTTAMIPLVWFRLAGLGALDKNTHKPVNTRCKFTYALSADASAKDSNQSQHYAAFHPHARLLLVLGF